MGEGYSGRKCGVPGCMKQSLDGEYQCAGHLKTQCEVTACYRQRLEGETKCNGHIGHDRKMETHPSFGTIGFSRYQGGGRLFGSSVKTHSGVSLRISQAQVRYNLGREWIHGTARPLVEIDMTETQFAQLLTSFGIGEGVPCTIRYVNGVGNIKEPAEGFNSEPSRIRDEFKDQAKEITEDLAATITGVNVILSKPTIGKQDRADILKLLERYKDEAMHGMPFLIKSFQESMDKVVSQAKTEVSVYIEQAKKHAGLEHAKGAPQIDLDKRD